MNTLTIRFSFTLLLVFHIASTEAQQFSHVNAGLVGVGRSSVAWGDYDSDGDLDLLITGNTGSGPYVASIYRNDAGAFININAGLTGIDNSSVAWGDYDNDGDLDILATGRSSGSSKTWLYNNAGGVFTPVTTVFHNVGSYGAVAWGDIDGDGDLDALVSGNYSTILYRNEMGAFIDMGVSLPMVSNSWVSIGDYDNDGDQDLFIMGDVGGWPVSVICENEQGFFYQHESTGILALSGGSASWCDYDHDQDPDILISGFDQYLEPKTSVFRNDGNMIFTNVYPGIAGAALGTSAWGDYDNDGDADVLLTGQNAACGTLSSIVYRNDGNNNFTDINAPLDGAERGSAAWGDYDNDGDLDIIISGFNGSGQPNTRLYQNNSGTNSYTPASPPDVPDNLQTLTNEHTVYFAWNNSTDNTTPVDGISYNLRVGTYSGGQDILPSNAGSTGSPLVPGHGNVGNNTSWKLNLEDGTYFWSVQALDHGYSSSDFSLEQQFTVLNVGRQEMPKNTPIQISPNPFTDRLLIDITRQSRFEIFNSKGLLICSGISEGVNEISTLTWPSGIYYLTFKGDPYYPPMKIIRK